ncbi:glycine zipper 2TM domain-containing protein [Phenylobacterium sp.]|uniref:glycine zipper 2TM domain-containing protein n=1 Tax=Phenylobacterium sp. TaxID=1871053 RepID=UPI002736CC9C|nr:glycine zipper 2TM domain-containing protein [Phenylobacterium sp.]MDP3659189.1 glycine zipper 2TM domain-containing protein [Phenylobacterium sp.]
MHTTLKLGLAGALAIATAMPAVAQPYGAYRPTEQYQRDLRSYDADRRDYEASRAEYDRRREDYERARADYDRRYGYGSYARAYGPAPVWSDDGYRDGERAYNDPRYNDQRYNDPCRQRSNNNAVAGGLIGAIAGAALGSNVAARNARTEGAVLGAVVGGALGANIGKSTAKCDETGYYFSYDETIPYRESRWDRDRRYRSGRYDTAYYNRQRCRLAPAPVEWNNGASEYRYVRVCPDGAGRYRITG